MQRIFTLIFFITLVNLAFGATDKYRLIITGDPSTTMTIGWNQISGHSVAVLYGTEDYGQDFQQYENFRLPDRTVLYKGMNNHFVRLTGLEPNTAYYFVIVDNEGVSQRFWFKTLPDTPDTPLSIIAGGDSRRSGSQTIPHEPRIESNRIVRAIRPDFVAFGGDYTDKDTDGQWQTWMDDWQYTTGEDGRMFPILPTRGNHERNNEVMINLFDVRQPDIYYAINFGGSLIRFYTLNVMISVAGDQTNWLRDDLQQNDDKTIWKMVQYHYSIAPHHSGKTYNTPMYLNWSPLFHQHRVQLIVECDSHVAKNTWPLRPTGESGSDRGFIRDDETGSVYTGEGSWGLIRDADQGYEWTREKGSFTQVKWIQANTDSLVVYTIKSATSEPVAPVADDDRFRMPDGLDLWTTENGDHFVIDRPNPNYNNPTTSTTAVTAGNPDLIDRLFPNPTDGQLNLRLNTPQRLRYAIFDLEGRMLRSGVLRGQQTTLSIQDIANGVFLLKVWNEATGQSQVVRFVKSN